jgi:hypothetical protein
MKFLSILFLFFVASSCSTQKYIGVSVLYYDKAPIDKFVLNKQIKQYIIYQTTLIENDFIVTGNPDSIASFLFWREGEQYYVKMIKKDHIFNSLRLDSITVFSDPSLKNVGASVSEETLNFVPPGLTPEKSEIFICKQNRKEFFFEVNGSHYYAENPRKTDDRLRIASLLRYAAKKQLAFFKVESNYKRVEIYDGE